MYEYTTESSCNPNSNTLEPDQPRMTAPLLELLPSSVLLLPSTDCPFLHTTKNLDRISKRLVFQVLIFFFNTDTANIREYLNILTELKMYEW